MRIYIVKLFVQTKMMIRTKRTYALRPFTPVTVFLITEKLKAITMKFSNFQFVFINENLSVIG